MIIADHSWSWLLLLLVAKFTFWKLKKNEKKKKHLRALIKVQHLLNPLDNITTFAIINSAWLNQVELETS